MTGIFWFVCSFVTYTQVIPMMNYEFGVASVLIRKHFFENGKVFRICPFRLTFSNLFIIFLFDYQNPKFQLRKLCHLWEKIGSVFFNFQMIR